MCHIYTHMHNGMKLELCSHCSVVLQHSAGYLWIGMLCEVEFMQLKVLCDFYLCDNTMSQTPPSRVGSGHETTCSSRGKSYQPLVEVINTENTPSSP